jgi:hypothetical protein
MNEGFPPLPFTPTETHPRRMESGRTVPLPPEKLAHRAEIGQILRAKVDQLSQHLRHLSDDERKAVFYKLEYEIGANPTNLTGTDLKPIAQPTPETIYAVPKEKNLSKLASKIDEFANAPVVKQHVPNAWMAYLKAIDEADPKDRLSDDLRKRYAALTKSRSLVCEIEFLSIVRGSNKQKKEIESWIKDLQKDFANGVHGNFFEHELLPPSCRAVIRCTGAMFKQLVEEPKWIERIRWIESRPRFQTLHEVLDAFRVQDLAPLGPPPANAPVVCVVDSGVTAGNPFLANVVRNGLVKSFLKAKPTDPNDEHGHGSAVASLAAYYALNLAAGAANLPKLWIASARILNEHNQIEDERLFSRVLEDVVKFFVKKDVRIFCLAIGDDRKVWGESSRRMLPRKSWVARRLDQLSREHDVVFVTCTGNVDRQAIGEFLGAGTEYPAYLAEESSQILDPGQAALAVTVGSLAAGTTIVSARDTKAIALRNQPSPFTRCGPGIRKEIKPELVDYGGNLAIDGTSGRVCENRGLQIAAASRRLTPAVSHWTGTSFATPRVAHRLAIIDQDLRSIGIKPSASLLRAFLVNSAAIREDNGELTDIREAFTDDDRDRMHWLMGYGLADQNRATGCDDYSTILYYQGELEPDHVLFFDVPVPAQLSRSQDDRRLTVTVAHAPEVQRWGLERYCGVELKWRMFRGDKSRNEIVGAMSEPQDESDQETAAELEVDVEDVTLPNELPFKPSLTRRSRGTIQHGSYTWSRHQRNFSDGHYTLAIAAYKRWQRSVENIPLGIVVRLEDLGRKVPIYAEVRNVVEVEI